MHERSPGRRRHDGRGRAIDEPVRDCGVRHDPVGPLRCRPAGASRWPSGLSRHLGRQPLGISVRWWCFRSRSGSTNSSLRGSYATAGSHPACRFSGDGTDFVDIRPYLPGDRLRDLNWRATAWQHSPQINRRMPERGGDVVIVLDALIDGYWTETEVGNVLVQRSGQAVWALVRNHLAAQDRVGLLAESSQSLGWIPPSGGTRARYKVRDIAQRANACPGSDHDQRPLFVSPDTARHSSVSARDRRLVVGKRRGVAITRIVARSRPSRLCAGDRQHRHDRGNRPTRPGTLRLAELVFQDRVAYLRRLGTPVVVWRPGQDLDRAVRRLGAATKRTTRLGMAR